MTGVQTCALPISTSQIDNVMDDDLDGFLNAYLTQLATGELKK